MDKKEPGKPLPRIGEVWMVTRTPYPRHHEPDADALYSVRVHRITEYSTAVWDDYWCDTRDGGEELWEYPNFVMRIAAPPGAPAHLDDEKRSRS